MAKLSFFSNTRNGDPKGDAFYRSLIKPTLPLSSRKADIFVPLSKVDSSVLRALGEGDHAILQDTCYNLL
jgi:hypothetical protein